ncbi:hypothetical protein FACS1894204_07230 [Synergistales bacterium]|nr:hypothetical protein FACS1894204_07230 [Synergistales bacterium]
MIANRYILMHKLYDVIKEYASVQNVPLRAALDVFYKSNLYTEIRTGISDMHCRSDGYLAEELIREMEQSIETDNPQPLGHICPCRR